MPILQIDIVGDSERRKENLAQRIADAAAIALNSRPGGTWVKLQFIATANYAENEGATEGLPIIASLIQAEIPTGDALRNQVFNLAKAISEAADHPVESVHIVIEPAAKGRIAFGGSLVE